MYRLVAIAAFVLMLPAERGGEAAEAHRLPPARFLVVKGAPVVTGVGNPVDAIAVGPARSRRGDKSGLAGGDVVNIQQNCLSASDPDIQTLVTRGVSVYYEPQGCTP